MTPAVTADSSRNRRRVLRAITIASVVLPVPGGPQRTALSGASPSTSRRIGAPGPSRCCCPTTSSSVRGRIRTASGATRSSAARSPASKRVSPSMRQTLRRRAAQEAPTRQGALPAADRAHTHPAVRHVRQLIAPGCPTGPARHDRVARRPDARASGPERPSAGKPSGASAAYGGRARPSWAPAARWNSTQRSDMSSDHGPWSVPAVPSVTPGWIGAAERSCGGAAVAASPTPGDHRRSARAPRLPRSATPSAAEVLLATDHDAYARRRCTGRWPRVDDAGCDGLARGRPARGGGLPVGEGRAGGGRRRCWPRWSRSCRRPSG